jgi:hypothetical protein
MAQRIGVVRHSGSKQARRRRNKGAVQARALQHGATTSTSVVSSSSSHASTRHNDAMCHDGEERARAGRGLVASLGSRAGPHRRDCEPGSVGNRGQRWMATHNTTSARAATCRPRGEEG